MNQLVTQSHELAKRIGEDKCKIIKVISDREGAEESEDTWEEWEA